MAVYTKTGDKGKTSIFNSKRRIRKDSQAIEAIGSVDEANSAWGVVKSFTNDKKIITLISTIQGDLFLIGSILAGAKYNFPSTKIKLLEEHIDILEGKLPVLSNFILPGGSKAASLLHLTRSITRRAERRLVSVSKINPNILSYINRLSDLAFMLARGENKQSKISDLVWIGK